MRIYKISSDLTRYNDIANGIWKEILSIPDELLKKAKDIIVNKEEEKTFYKVKICDIQDTILLAIDANKVSALMCNDFVAGGNDMAYGKDCGDGGERFVPYNEIWVDGRLELPEMRFIVLHECIERYLMHKYDFTYEKAHNIANEFESQKRKESLGIKTPE